MPSSRSPLFDFTMPCGPPSILWTLCACARGAPIASDRATRSTGVQRSSFDRFTIAFSCSVRLPVWVCAAALFQRLDAYDPAVMIDVPDRHRVGGIVDPAFAVEAVGLRQHVFDPVFGLRVVAHVAAGMHLAGPDLAVLVGLRGIERRV